MTTEDFKAIDWNGFRPRIECRGADTLPLDAIEDFQKNLKRRNKKDVENIMRSIYEYGFSFPFAVWEDEGHAKCIDGHGRILALAEMRKRGADLPCFPVSYVSAHDEAEAKQKLLRLNSAYGTMTQASVIEFMGDIELDASEISLPGISFGSDEAGGVGDGAGGTEDDNTMNGIIVTVELPTLAGAYELAAELLGRGMIAKIKEPK